MDAVSGGTPTVLVGRVSDVGPTYVLIGKTRLELAEKQRANVFEVGYSTAVMAVAVDDKLVSAGSCTRWNSTPRTDGALPSG